MPMKSVIFRAALIIQWNEFESQFLRIVSTCHGSYTFSPATGAHTSNLLPFLSLECKVESDGHEGQYRPFLASLDIKDAFLQVPQADPTQVDLRGSPFVVLRDLPGQRQGSRAWYWFFRNFLSEQLGFSSCAKQPCLARVEDAVVLMHVDDLLYCGSYDYFHGTFLKKVKEQFTVNFAELGTREHTSTFPRRK